MTGPRHLPLIAWSKQELINARDEHQRWLDVIDAESARRGDRDDKRHGFAVAVRDKPGVIGTAYRYFETPAEAYDAAIKEFPELHDAAPYRVHPVYLGKDD